MDTYDLSSMSRVIQPLASESLVTSNDQRTSRVSCTSSRRPAASMHQRDTCCEPRCEVRERIGPDVWRVVPRHRGMAKHVQLAANGCRAGASTALCTARREDKSAWMHGFSS